MPSSFRPRPRPPLLGARLVALLSALVSASLAALLAAGCSGERYCRLVVEDPEGLAGEGAELVILVEGREVVRAPVAATDFPLTQVLSGSSELKRAATVEVWNAGVPAGRDAVTLELAERVTTVTAILQEACDTDEACDDGVFANGAETCAGGVCVAGDPPCVAAVACVDVAASEELQSCVVTPRHERCEPILTDTGESLLTFCDAVAGCLPGQACETDGADCESPDACSAAPLCVAGRCVPRGPLPVDDDNPCTIDLCDATSGVLHLEDGGAAGNSCALAAGGAGICLEGACVASRCGDGFVDRLGGEACDDGDGENSDTVADACRLSCALPACGDGVTDLGEDCDDGDNGIDDDACLQGCRANVCGDGRLNAGVEECDDANTFAQDACLPGCVLNVCGDGVRDFTDEECDDGNLLDFDGCSSACDFVAWEVDLGEPLAATSAPVAWELSVDRNGTVETVKALGVVTAAGTLVALDRESGAELWRYAAGAPATAPPAAGAHGVYMITDDGVVHGNALGGPAERPAWTFALDRPSNGAGLTVPVGPTTDGVTAVDEGGKLYQLTHLGALRGFQSLAFNASYDVSTDARTFDAAATVCPGCTPTMIHSLAPGFLSNDNGAWGLVMPMAGEVWAWRFSSDCNPTRFAEGDVLRQVSFRGFRNSTDGDMVESPFYATLASGVLRRAEVDTSGCTITIADRVDASGDSPFVTAPVVTIDPFTGEDAIYVVEADGLVHRLVFTPGNPGTLPDSFGWPTPLGAPTVAAPALGRSGDLFLVDEGGVVHALDGIAALELWSLSVRGGAPAGSPIVSDGAVFVATVGGIVTALERGDEQPLATSWSRNGGNARGNGHPVQCANLGGSGTASLTALGLWLFVARRRPRRPA